MFLPFINQLDTCSLEVAYWLPALLNQSNTKSANGTASNISLLLILSFTLWLTWKNHNSYIFEELNFTLNQNVILQKLQNTSILQIPLQKRKRKNYPVVCQVEQQDTKGEWVLGFLAYSIHTTAISTEIRSLLRGLQLALQHGFTSMQINIDTRSYCCSFACS